MTTKEELVGGMEGENILLTFGCLIERDSNSEAAISEDWLGESATQLHSVQLSYCSNEMRLTN